MMKVESVQDRIQSPQLVAQGGAIVPVTLWAARDDGAPQWGTPLLRAAYLDDAWRNDSRLSGVMVTMVSRMAANGWSISGPVEGLPRYYDLFAQADETGWTDFIRLGYLNYLATDEGVVFETARAWYPNGPMLKLWHVDSSRCVPGPVSIGGQVYPLLFQDVTTWKPLQAGQFYRMCSLPAPDQFRRRLGFCFMSRVLRFARWANDIMLYQEEKVKNLPAEGIATVAGLTKSQVENAFAEYEQARKQREMLIFPGVLWFVANTYGQEAAVTFTSFREVWAGFSDREVNEIYMKVVALDAGVDVGEFWQVEFHGATKAASWLQHQKSWGKGPAEFIVAFERFAARFLPVGYHWMFDVPDDEQDMLTARIHGQEIRNVKDLFTPPPGLDTGLIDKEEAREMLAQKGIIPQRYVQPPERVATDVLRSTTGRTVGTARWPDGHVEVHRPYWQLDVTQLIPTKATWDPRFVERIPRIETDELITVVQKDWSTLTTLFRSILSRWKADVFTRLEEDDSSLDEDSYWQDWSDAIQAAVFDDFFVTAMEGIEASGLLVDFDTTNDVAQRVAQERAFEMVSLDGETSIVRSTRDSLDRIREKLASGELAWTELETALTPLFGDARAEKIAVSENTDLWAEAQLSTAEEAGMLEKRSVRADAGRPCPSNICIEAEAAGWVPLSEEIVPGYRRPKYHPGCYCLLRFR